MRRAWRLLTLLLSLGALANLGCDPGRLWPLAYWTADGIVVGPYLQAVSDDGITVMWRTNRPTTSRVHYGPTAALEQTVEVPGARLAHEVAIRGLEAGRQYFYKVESVEADGRMLRSPCLTFQTAVVGNQPFAFAIIGDTQSNPRVARRLAGLAWDRRPGFLVHVGDLVGCGTSDYQWRGEFFASMDVLLRRVAMFPVLGNHEEDANQYYEFMSLPAPESYYTAAYGNARFFMLDSNRPLGPSTPQFVWLERQLAACKATWKIVCLHHPAYSSDSDDYGDLWVSGTGTFGDLNARCLAPLYDRYGVDLVCSGHIHSYERTWPLRGGAVVEEGGCIYLTTGGGGGALERPGPSRQRFSNVLRYGHHFVMVHVSGGTLEAKAYDLGGRLFDAFRLSRSTKGRER